MTCLQAIEAAERWVDARLSRHQEPPPLAELVDFLLEETDLPVDLTARLEALADRCQDAPLCRCRRGDQPARDSRENAEGDSR